MVALAVVGAVGCAQEGGSGGEGKKARPSTSSQVPSDADPLILVHGLGGGSADWDTFRGWFERDGYSPQRIVAVDFPPNQRNQKSARTLVRTVNRVLADTGASKVDFVAFSMGNYPVRYYLKYLGGAEHTDSFAGMSGPNRGMDTSLTAGCAEDPHSRPDACQMWEGSAFLRKLNAGDDTPGGTDYGTWRSRADEVVPPQSTPLKGADNRVVPGELRHVDLLGDERVYGEVRDFLQ